MQIQFPRWHAGAVAVIAMLMCSGQISFTVAQDQAAATDSAAAAQAPEPLDEDELEILVARIALYPDELVAVISEAALYPLQIVEASRFLDQVAKKASLKPKESWDGSVISLLNYPEIVKMMGDDLDWTQTLGDALTYQQKDVLIAIQQLRDKAVAKGVIKTDDKIRVVEENDNVVIRSVSADTIYVPRYEPEMLYATDYPVAPISYYPDPYPSYYYPTAPYFAAFVTGAVWAAAVDWNDWGVWGGRWNGNDIDIDCNNCFNNINGKVNFNDVDWKNVDRSKLKFDRNQFANFDKTSIRDRVKSDDRNNMRNKASDLKRDRMSTLAGKSGKVKDVRQREIREGLKNRPPASKPDFKKPTSKKPASVRKNDRSAVKASGKINRSVGKPKPAMRVDNRPRSPSGLGNVSSGKRQQIASNRGARSMGGGIRSGGGGNKMVRRGSGGGRRR
ncbi:DUF3300 domain-containing protein [Mesorhizobium sp. YC-39]|uniref:DUF3300 domain-containing protein n=1 Tax=unclassified Mesorhizobium TaxID=325217 RepID=UPI0021E95F45|nr:MULTISPECIES: DUF3300 domain-containing protein [unclassified Mesorhizobium]MCV3210715.1 DUF3300 domain-containing protein [Mesorhizobium sp. YC-2]MCV3230949.1 DUF3300 domain-containing protein [Mesorhizobium sp. YC-39]